MHSYETDSDAFSHVSYQVLTQGRGALTRILILQRLAFQPANANRLARLLGIDYKTLKHHLRILEESKFISRLNKTQYASIYCLTSYFRSRGFFFTAKWAGKDSAKVTERPFGLNAPETRITIEN